jgi:hypothetical protein
MALPKTTRQASGTWVSGLCSSRCVTLISLCLAFRCLLSTHISIFRIQVHRLHRILPPCTSTVHTQFHHPLNSITHTQFYHPHSIPSPTFYSTINLICVGLFIRSAVCVVGGANVLHTCILMTPYSTRMSLPLGNQTFATVVLANTNKVAKYKF